MAKSTMPLAATLIFCLCAFAWADLTLINGSYELDDNGDPNYTKRNFDNADDGKGGVLAWYPTPDGIEPRSGVEAASAKAWGVTTDGLMQAYAIVGHGCYQILNTTINAGDGFTIVFDGLAAGGEIDLRASFVYEDAGQLHEIDGQTFEIRERRIWYPDLTTGFTAQAGQACIGKNLGIRISSVGPADGWWGIWDNVRVYPYNNNAPVVDAGSDQNIELPQNSATLNGVITDDGLPDPPQITSTWEKISGPGDVTFVDPYLPVTTATFTQIGYYTLRLTASDGSLTASDDINVTLYLAGGTMTNQGEYPNGKIPKYEKFEADFNINTNAPNYQLPYDASPPAGVTPEMGVSVDVQFTPDNWTTVYSQPAFFYEDFLREVKGNRDWIYPSGHYTWKVRFTPKQIGTWHYKAVITDLDGTRETEVNSFEVVDSDLKGFIRVSSNDHRYFEFDNGQPFTGLGHNLRYGELDWDSPIRGNESDFTELKGYGMQLFRTWLSHWGIFGSSWNPWQSPLSSWHANNPPWTALTMNNADPSSEAAMVLAWDNNPGMFLGFSTGLQPAVKRNTDYHVAIRYKIISDMDGPRIAGNPYGLVAKTGGWLSGDHADDVYGYCNPGTGNIVSNYAHTATNGWQILEGTYSNGSNDYMPYFYLVLENITDLGGTAAYIDYVEICEDLGNGEYGPNILNKPWMAHHLYMDQKDSFAFDKVLDLAEQYDIYFKLVLLESQDWILNRFGGFLGDYRTVDKTRWLQQAWWRYCQARWGYSPNIHSWELLNEGNPFDSRHYALADEMGKYMHQFIPNVHLCTTSTWHSFPKDQFWANANYPDVDYADVHKYETSCIDAAASTVNVSTNYGALQPGGADKPVIRGEVGFGSGVNGDSDRIWYHNFIWGQINHGGLYDLYWCENNEFGTGLDPRTHAPAFRYFMEGIPINNGHYQQAYLYALNNDLRGWGQKDLQNGRAHLWLQNSLHTWKNIVDGVPIPPLSDNPVLDGFPKSRYYRLDWYDPYDYAPIIPLFEDGAFVSPWLSQATGGTGSNLPFEASTAPDGSGAAYADMWPGGEAGRWTLFDATGDTDISSNSYLEFDIYFDTDSSPGHTIAAICIQVNDDDGWQYKWENQSVCWLDGVLTDMDDGIPDNDLPMTGNQWHHFKLDLSTNALPTGPGGTTPLPNDPDLGIIRFYFEGVADGAEVYLKNAKFTNGSDSGVALIATELVQTDNGGVLTMNVTDLDTDIALKISEAVGDITGDGAVDEADLAELAAQWLTVPTNKAADMAPRSAGDDFIDLQDFAVLGQNWKTDHMD